MDATDGALVKREAQRRQRPGAQRVQCTVRGHQDGIDGDAPQREIEPYAADIEPVHVTRLLRDSRASPRA